MLRFLTTQGLLNEASDEQFFATPKGNWRPFTLAAEDPSTDSAHPMLRLRPGAILPVGPGGQTTNEAFEGALTLIVALDEHGKAKGRLYEDAGEGYGYRDGEYLLTTYEATLENGEAVVRITHQEGSYESPFDELVVVLLEHPLGERP